MNSEQQMAHMTTRLLVTKADGLHTGTGFYVGFNVGNGRSKIFCVTNRHVLSGAKRCSLPITTAGADEMPQYGQAINFDLEDIADGTIFHPDDAVDLAAFPVHSLLNAMSENGHRPFIKAIRRDDIPKPEVFSDLSLAEDILMIGYPNGLFDAKNNMPILRRGITATSPSLEFNGQQVFVVDCACFPGSSGSPVFLHQPMGYRQPNGDLILGGGRSILIGVLFAGPQVSVAGEIVPRAIPTSAALAVRSQAMMHLGFCIRSTEIAFLDQFAKPD